MTIDTREIKRDDAETYYDAGVYHKRKTKRREGKERQPAREIHRQHVTLKPYKPAKTAKNRYNSSFAHKSRTKKKKKRGKKMCER
jgi:hypothetical protein